MSRDAFDNLGEDNGAIGYSFDKYKQYFNQFCQVATDFRCSANFSAKSVIGSITKDWDALGFARSNPADDVCSPAARDASCNIHNWEKAQSYIGKNFGVRVFLVQNSALDDIPQRILIDVDNPEMQMIPFLPEKPDISAHRDS